MNSPQISPRTSPLPFTAALASLRCAACEVENRAERQFCAGCGARLWEPCIRCGRTNASTEQHCGDCGASLEEELKHFKSKLEEAIADAEQLAADGLHPQAIERLQNIAVPDHSQLADYPHELASRIALFRGQMLRANRERDEAIVEGRALLAGCQYEQAAVLLERVAEPYRTDEFRRLLDEVRSRQVEMLTLAAEIRRAMSEKRTEGLLEKVEELLRLKPDHEQARSLAERLRPLEQKRKLNEREAIYQAAQALLERHDYASALTQLELIPADLRTPQLAKLITETEAKAAESAWLSRDLHEAVIYDQHLLPIGERLQKLHPNDQELGRLVARLRDLPANKGPKHKPKTEWPSPPAESAWGPPLETIRAFRRIDISSIEKSESWRDDCDRFCVAAGLALQGLAKGYIDVNLVPPEKTSLLSRFRAKKKPTAAWGIDAGRAAIKAIRLSCSGDDGRIVAEAAEYLEYATPLNVPDADRDSLFAKSLESLLKRDDLGDAVICVGIPAHKVLYRSVALPLIDDKKLGELMGYEIRQQIPFAVEQAVWGYQPLANRSTEFATVREWDLALFALKIEETIAAVAPFRDRGVKVDVLASDAAALFNFLTFESGAHGVESGTQPLAGYNGETHRGDGLGGNQGAEAETAFEPVTVVLDVGTDSSNVIITNGHSLQMRAIPLGGNSFSRTMVKEFQLTFEQAEKIKRNPLAVRELHRLYGALEPRLADLSREVSRTIDNYIQASPARRLERFVVVGGGLKLHGALRRLWHGQ